MSHSTLSRRAHGTGTLYAREQASGQEVWYGRWYLGGRRVNRRLGPKRRRGSGHGLNRTQAEAELRRLMVRERPPARGSAMPFASVVELMLCDLEALERKPTTLDNYRAILRAHLLPRFGELPINRVRKRDIEEFMAALSKAGLAARTRSGIFKLLSQVFAFAERHGWCQENPCRLVRPPRLRESSEIRFLNHSTAAMTGMRQGELVALRWRDVDSGAKRIRVRRTYTRGHWSTPKSRSGERSVPLSSKVEAELRAHLGRSVLGRGRPGLRQPAERRGPPPRPARAPLQEGAEGGRGARGPFPRSAPHLRHQDRDGRSPRPRG